jgi:hypothetical protein
MTRSRFASLPWVAAILLGCAPEVRAADPTKNGEAWKFDRITLKSGKILQGLIDREDEKSIQLRYVVQNPPSPTSVFVTTIDKKEIEPEGIHKLPAEERAILKARLDAIDRASEKKSIDRLVLEPTGWGKDPRGGLSYTASQFVLISNAPEEIVRRAAYRLDQIYLAYSRHLPARCKDAERTRIYLYDTLAGYHEAVKARGQTILNPALYDPLRNEILCASDLRRLGEDLEKYKKEHGELLERLKAQKQDLLGSHKGKLTAKLKEQLEQLDAECKKIESVQKANDRIFDQATERLFRTLYHESFHAYLANFVYRSNEAEIPRWLNEGLAQIFETAIVEAGELRVGHADRIRLSEAQKCLKDGKLVSIRELLHSGPNAFVVGHANDQATSDRYYLTSWAVAFYLTFGLDKLHSPEMTRYARQLKQGMDPTSAFVELVGRSPEDFEQEFHQYLGLLRPSGVSARLGSRRVQD